MPKLNIRTFQKRGFLHLRRVFSVDEIHDLRKRALESESHGGDLLSNPQLRSVLSDPRIVAVARELLGDTPVYFGDGTLFSGGHDTSGFHKDNADRYDAQAPDWQRPYTLIRFGLYLQDHAARSGGLLVKCGSHNTVSLTKGRTAYLATRLGDLAVWNMRITHCGHGMRLKALPWLGFAPKSWLASQYPSLFAEPCAKRMALFFSFGLDDAHLHRYVAYLKTRRYMTDMWRNSQWDEAASMSLAKAGVRHYQGGIDTVDQRTARGNEEYVPIGY